MDRFSKPKNQMVNLWWLPMPAHLYIAILKDIFLKNVQLEMCPQYRDAPTQPLAPPNP